MKIKCGVAMHHKILGGESWTTFTLILRFKNYLK